MAKTAPGTLVVSTYNPSQTRKRAIIVALLWLASLVILYFFCKNTMTPGYTRAQSDLAQAHSEIVRLQSESESLKAQASRFERGEQVAKEASKALQDALDARQQEVASLRADLSFFQRFAGGGNTAEVLGVQDISLVATDNPRVFEYSIAIGQNLKSGKVVKGKLRFTVSGISEGKPKRLDMTALLGEGAASAIDYQFKYFQLFNGTIYLPEGFAPGAIKARMVNENGESADKEVTWEVALKAAAG